MAVGNWGNARQLLSKALHKDSLNIEAELLVARWFLDLNNPGRHVDSAYYYSIRAVKTFNTTAAKQKDKLKRNLVDSASIVTLRSKIDSVAFEEAKQINSEKSYNDFLGLYQFASQRNMAVELRDEVAFLNALKVNSTQAFENYIKQYPKANRAREARDRLEKLLFETYTHDKKLNSYLAFLKKFPASHFRLEAEKNIFEITTSSGSPEDFIHFTETYPGSSFSPYARNILFHIRRETEEKIPTRLLNDSLKKVIELNKLIWAPVYKNGKYGFMDLNGTETLAPQYDNIDESYRCGYITDDILLTSAGLISRSGRWLASAAIIKNIGYGFLKLGDSTCVHVLHKSGKMILKDCAQDIRVLGGRFLVVKKNNLLSLVALNGRMLLGLQWQSIQMIEGVVVLDQYGKKTICTVEQLARVADGNVLPETLVFDDVRAIDHDMLLVRNGSLEGILNSRLEWIVPLGPQSLAKTAFGLVRKINDQFIFAGLSPDIENMPWKKYRYYKQWLLLTGASGQVLFDTHSKKIVEQKTDSIWFDRGLAFARRGDSVRVHVNSSTQLSLHKNLKIDFVQASDSIRYFLVDQKNRKTIFSIATGEKLFSEDYDKIESLFEDHFIVTKKNKKGLLNKSGKPLLLPEYDELLLNNYQQLSLLKNKKFGLYDLKSGKLIKPEFERNILQLDSTILIVFKNGFYGLMDWNTMPIGKFEFDEIQPWTKNVIWARLGFEWSLIDFRQQKKILAHIKNFHLLKDRPEEKLAIIQQENYYGAISTTHGVIISPAFSLVENIGSADEPLFFTSKEVEEAQIVVVIYYDRHGKLLRKQVYEESEFAKIVCQGD